MRELYIHETADLQTNPKPSNPDNGFIRIYKRDGALKILDSTGNESSIELGVNTSHNWRSGINYVSGDIIFNVDHAWKCIGDHTSTIFSDDIVYWELLTRGYSLIRTTTPGIIGQPVYESSPGFYSLASASDIATTASGIISYVFNASNFIICSIDSKEKITTAWASLGISGGNLSPGTIYYLSDTIPGNIVTFSDSLFIQQPLYKAIDSTIAEVVYQKASSDSYGIRIGQIIETNEKITLSPDKPFIDLSETKLINESNFPLLTPILDSTESDEVLEIEDVKPAEMDIIGAGNHEIYLGKYESKNVMWNNNIHNLPKISKIMPFSSFKIVSYATANNTIVCIGDTGGMLYSLDDGDTWSYTRDFDNMSFASCVIKIGTSSFMVFGRSKTNSNIVVTTYQNTMTPIFTRDTNIVGSVIAGPITSATLLSSSVIVAVGPEKKIIYTSDGGFTWASGTSDISSGITLNKIVYVASVSKFISIGTGGTIIDSPDGATWTTKTSGTANTLVDIVFNNSTSTVIACGYSGTIVSTVDGNVWAVRTSGTANHLSAITRVTPSSYTYISVGSSGTIITSPDGITWTLRTSGTTNNIYDVIRTSTPGYCLALHAYGIVQSNDGSTWYKNDNFFDTTTGNNFSRIIINSFSTKLFIIGGEHHIYKKNISEYYTKLDCVTTQNNSIYGIVHDGNDFVGVGSAGQISIIDSNYDIKNADSGVKQKLNSIVYNNGKYVAVGACGTILLSYDKIIWNKIELPLNIPNIYASLNLNKIRVFNNMYIAVGDNGLMITSFDGLTWKKISTGTTADLYDIAFRSSTALYVIVGSGGIIRTSPNLVTWTTRASGTTNTIRSVYYNGTIFVYGADNGPIVRSSADAVTWTLRTSNAIGDVNDIIWNGSLFYLISEFSVVTSSNGTAWNQPISDLNALYTKCACSSGSKIVIGGNQKLLCYSNDSGSSWSHKNINVSSLFDTNSFAESADGKTIVIVNSNGGIKTSTDGGKTFLDVFENKTAVYNTLIDVVYDGTKYVGITSSNILYSTDLKKWIWIPSPIGITLKSIVYNGSLFVVVGTGGIITSPDGITWISRTAAAPNSFNSVEWNGSLFIAVGDTGAIKTSPDGITWTARTSGTTEPLNKVKYGDGITVIGGGTSSTKVFLRSFDGITWTSYTISIGNEIIDIEYGQGTFLVIFKNYNAILRMFLMMDGSTQAVYFSVGSTQDFYRTIYDGEKFLIFSSDGPYVFSPLNGITIPLKKKPVGQLNHKFGKIYSLIISNERKIVFSTSGLLCSMDDIDDFNDINIIQTFRNSINDICFANNMFVAVGNNSMIIRSYDGISWKMIPDITHTSLVYNNDNYNIIFTDKFVIASDIGLKTSPDGIAWNNPYYGYEYTDTYTIIPDSKKFISNTNNNIYVFDQYGNFNRFNNSDMSIVQYSNPGNKVSFKNVVYSSFHAKSVGLIDSGSSGQKMIVTSTSGSILHGSTTQVISSPGATSIGSANIKKIKMVNNILFCFADNDLYGPYYISNINDYLNSSTSSIGKWKEELSLAGQSITDIEYTGSVYRTVDSYGAIKQWSGNLNNLILDSTISTGNPLKFVSGNVAVADNGMFFQTPDSGATWNEVRNYGENILKIINISNLYYAITLNKTIVSSDGGLTWNEFSDSYNRIDIAANGTNAAIVCENKYVLSTVDSGSTWNPILVSVDYEFSSVYYQSGNYYAYTNNPGIFHSSVYYASSVDSTSWNQSIANSVYPINVNSITNAFGKIYLMCDNGALLQSDSDGNLSSMAFQQSNTLYCAIASQISSSDWRLSVFGSNGESFNVAATKPILGAWDIQNIFTSAGNIYTAIKTVKKLTNKRILIRLKKTEYNIETAESFFNGKYYYGMIGINGITNVTNGVYQILGFNKYDMTIICELIDGLTVPASVSYYPFRNYDTNAGMQYLIENKIGDNKNRKYYMYAKKYIP